MKTRIAITAGSVTLAAALALGACSSSGDHGGMSMSSDTTQGTTSSTVAIPADAVFNATDVGFAQGMIPHHAQAIEMAEMALEKTESAEVRSLATAIKAAQQPEIDELSGWLQDWGQTVPETSEGGAHDMSGTSGMMMSGMMSSTDMESLDKSEGVEFDRMFLEMMILHHEGAISMAEDEVADGKFANAKAMAQTISSTQQTEISEMEALLSAM